jgi:sporulation protein YlmC with PRC-barrel domain
MPDRHAEERKGPNRLDADWLDGALHLLDRQVLDSNGMNICNVDDLEIADGGPRGLAVTGLLVGPAALVPRFSGRLGGWLQEVWIRLGEQYADRERPLRIGLDQVVHVGSDVRLRVPRTGLLDRQPPAAADIELRRLDDLLGMKVNLRGSPVGRVLDVRLTPRREQSRLELHSLIVGRGRPGSLLGYDRGDFNGPRLVSAAVRWLHRHTGEVLMDAVTGIDWSAGEIEVGRAPASLRGR